MKVDELMTGRGELVTVSPEASLKEVGELLVEHSISGAPVVDAEGRVLGVVSEADFVREQAGEDGKRGLLARIFSEEHPPTPTARTTGEAMTSPAVTIGAERTVVQAARLMEAHGVNRLPVVDDAETLVGIITRADIVRAFVRSDEEIARELREDVVRGILWLDPDAVQITVEEGEVLLRGRLDTEASARLLEHFAARVPGVVSVRSELHWRND